jgi:serine/threonine-protein kinase
MTDILSRLATALADRYEVGRELGAGGMATVYLTRDLKHDRTVALKVLRPELAAVLGVERFLSEIRVMAHLQHPHLLPLFDSGQADGLVYYVMPHVEGESLRDRLQREKELPLEDALDIARAVASALDYAHRHGVIHRDIKPENILFQDAQAVVADFGIALALSEASGSRLTETGLSLGTPQYMSPEQATGDRQIDARSDIYALASVLYEMLAGEPPHTGPTVQSVIAKVLTDRPRRLSTLRGAVPAHVEAAVHKALAKVPADRFQTAAQFAEALTHPPAVSVVAEAPPAPARGVGVIRLAAGPWALGAVAIAAAVWGWLRSRPEPPPPPVARFRLQLPGSAALSFFAGPVIAMSPDGSRLVYVGRGESGNQLFVRPLNRLDPVPLPGTSTTSSPFFSPDGQWVAFFSGRKLLKTAVGGGPVLPVCDVPGPSVGGTWGPGDMIVFAHAESGLLSVPAAGGTPRLILARDTVRRETYTWPEYLPDGKAVLFTIRTREGDRLGALTLATGAVRRFAQAGSNPHYVSSGHVVLATPAGTIVAVPFDTSRLEVTGAAVGVVQQVVVGVSGAAKMGMSRDGAFAYQGGRGGVAQMVLVDRSGRVRALPAEPQEYRAPRLSPDGKRIVLETAESGLSQNTDIWVYDLAQHTRTRLTFDRTAQRPVWTPDGRRIVFSRGQDADLYWIPADGSGPAESLLVAPGDQYPGAFTPDGRTLLYRSGGFGDTRSIHFLRLDSTRTPHPYLVTEFQNHSPALSPDGRWVAYVSNESGQAQVYVRPFPGPGGRWQVSLDGGVEPVWAPGGAEIFYRTDSKMMVAAVRTRPAFAVGERRQLFDGNYGSLGGVYRDYDVTRDGRSFVMIQALGEAQDVIIVLNWFRHLRDERHTGGAAH